METVAVPLNADAETQIINLSIAPNGHAVSLRLEIRWLDNAGKWYLTVYDATTDACLVSLLPLIASGNKLNDLLGQFGHLRIGSAALVPVSSTPSSADPGRDNLADFELLWGDCIAYDE